MDLHVDAVRGEAALSAELQRILNRTYTELGEAVATIVVYQAVPTADGQHTQLVPREYRLQPVLREDEDVVTQLLESKVVYRYVEVTPKEAPETLK